MTPIPFQKNVFRGCLRSAAAAILFLSALPRASAEDWPAFRGPTGMGTSTAVGLPLEWGGSDAKNVLWKVPLPPTVHGGDPDLNPSSPVVSGGKLFVTTAHWPKGTANQREQQPEHRVAAYDAATGKVLWDRVLPPGPWQLRDLRGGYAVPTPVVAGGRIFALFGSSILHALDVEGNLLWSHTLSEPDQFDVALASSPVVFKDTVLLLLDRKKPSASLIALDVATGVVRWEKKRPETDFGHMSPVLTSVDGMPQLLVCATHALESLDPSTGEPLWTCPWGRKIWPVSSPVLAKGLLYAIGGRAGHPGVVVDPRGRGDLSDTHLKWRVGAMAEGVSSPIAVGDLVFKLTLPETVRCVRIESGEELFKARLQGLSPDVSPFATADGRIYFASAGKSIVLQAGPELKVLAESDLGDPSGAAAAVADGRIFLKGKSFLYAIGISSAAK